MKTASELTSVLSGFYGTDGYHMHSIVGTFGAINLTDGAAYLRENAECFWLFDIISSILPKIKGEEFWAVKLTVKDREAKFTVDDGNGNILYKQKITYTTFPLSEITLFVTDHRAYGQRPVVMLTSEY